MNSTTWLLNEPLYLLSVGVKFILILGIAKIGSSTYTIWEEELFEAHYKSRKYNKDILISFFFFLELRNKNPQEEFTQSVGR